MGRLTPTKFKKKAKEVHNDKYDYSMVEYIYAKDKILIVCPEHGLFEQSPSKHLSGQGCPKCGAKASANSQRSSTAKFITQAQAIHGDAYGYGNVCYVNNKTKVTITCDQHGDFKMTPSNHTHKTNPQGCPTCGGRTPWNQELFVKEASSVHNHKYDYSKVVFKKLTTKVIIGCPEHRDFKQSPSHHLNRKQGCPKCSKTQKGTKEKFVEKARKIHEDIYDYDKVEYKNNKSKVTITCRQHGYFEMTPGNHTHKTNPQGCPECSGRKKWTKEAFFEEAEKVHHGEYDYSQIIWNGMSKPVKIICQFHGEFTQKPRIHLMGSGCQKCRSSRGETKIRQILTSQHIDFEEQYRFADCQNFIPLPFDFCLNFDGKKALIEYQGEQHFRPVDFGNHDEIKIARQFERIKENDFIKAKWCQDNEIPLLTVPYTEYEQIESHVMKFITNNQRA